MRLVVTEPFTLRIEKGFFFAQKNPDSEPAFSQNIINE
jgi:hypothetical protein